MSRIDHARANARDRMARQGVERIDDFDLPAAFRAPPKRRASKAGLRAELEAATAKITRIVRCQGCGHAATVALPPARVGARLRCSKCGELAR
ncbi:hypothetical protein [Chelativorans intermedius]|uniref:DksA C4-type domain-containing protein n=1 Tax=Chelativorans intermedius TaxID=515947 RepID=A0ABV6D7I2_9HYPH|nr:hypothetical protein [Chelativorans intermedius]MCT8999215.1 hypothetical protein [Chelativorans intermedius]